MSAKVQDERGERYALHRRFDRLGRLVGDAAMQRLFATHVMVIGVGGVGSYAVEMLARSGIGRLTLVDFDEICVTNVNRQLPALSVTVGQRKVDVLAERMLQINPRLSVQPLARYYDASSADELLAIRPDFLIDAIDSITAKAHLLDRCLTLGIRVVTAVGSGGRIDPTAIRCADLSAVHGDPLARHLKKLLRGRHQRLEDAQTGFGLPAVHSLEPPSEPVELAYDEGQGFRCICPQGQDPDRPFSCERRQRIYGTAGFVTGAFGFAAASVIVRHVAVLDRTDREDCIPGWW
jgi:tRNA A37 threonylcarbamoyladenosine dehydratase